MQRIGRYQVLGELARGGMGVVYKGYDPKKRFEVAIKVLLAGRDANEQARERFHREARALGKLRHPHVVAVDEVGDHEGHPYLVMELLQGESLQARLDRDGPLPVDQAVTIVRKVAEALHYAHEQGILHRDVKPENVVIDPRGEPLLADFGLTRDLDPATSLSTLSIKGRCMGTPGYWPPEQAHGELEKLGPHSDVYALGGTLVALLTGLPPHGEPASMIEAVVHTTQAVEPPSARRPEIGEALDAVCLRALAVEPAARYASAAAFAADLDAVASGRPRTAPRTRPAAPQVAQPQRPQLLVAVGIGLLGVLATAGILAYRFPDPRPAPLRRVDPRPAAGFDSPPSPVERLPLPAPVESPSPALRLAEDRDPLALAAYLRGLRRAEAGDTSQAIEDYTEALRLEPHHSPAYYARGVARGSQGDSQGAAEDFTQAIRFDPELARAYHNRGLMRTNLGDHRGAIQDYTQALRLGPQESSTYYARGVARGSLGDHQGAVEDYTQAIRLDPTDADAYNNRGAVRGEALGDFQGEVDDCTEAIRLRPDHAIAYAGRGFARGKLGLHQDALEDLERALSLEPDAGWASQARGWLKEARAKLAE